MLFSVVVEPLDFLRKQNVKELPFAFSLFVLSVFFLGIAVRFNFLLCFVLYFFYLLGYLIVRLPLQSGGTYEPSIRANS